MLRHKLEQGSVSEEISRLHRIIQAQSLEIERLRDALKSSEKELKITQEMLAQDKAILTNYVGVSKKKHQTNKPSPDLFQGHTHNIFCLLPLPHNKLASGSVDKTIKIWDLQNGTCIHTLRGHTAYINCLELLSNGQLASGSADKCIKIWDLQNGNCLATLEGHEGPISSLVHLPNDELMSAGCDNNIIIWDLKRGICINFPAEPTFVCCLQRLPTGIVVCAERDGPITLWSSYLGRGSDTERTFKGHTQQVTCFQELSNNRLASSSLDKTIKIWDLNRGMCLKTLQGHTDYINSIQVLPDEKLASASDDKTIKIWDLRNGKCITTLQANSEVDCLQLLPNGQLISGSKDSIRSWDITQYVLAVESEKPVGPGNM